MLGTMPLWEPPLPDLNCPLALPGEGEPRTGAQRSRWLPTRLKGPAHTPPPSQAEERQAMGGGDKQDLGVSP